MSVQALDDLLDETLKLIVCLRERTPHAAMPRKLNALCQVHALSAFEAALAVHPHLASVKAAVDSVSAELRAKRRQQAAAGCSGQEAIQSGEQPEFFNFYFRIREPAHDNGRFRYRIRHKSRVGE